MIDLTMWVLADADGKVWRDWDGAACLFRTRKAANEYRKNNLLRVHYDRYEPKKVTVRDAK